MPAKPRPHAATAAALAVALIGTFAVVALVASSGAAAAAKQPQCGDTIKKDTTLHKDLINCAKNAIVIGADGITLDLNGHLIDGDETSTKNTCDCAVVDEGHDGVTVKNGSVREFDGGVGVEHARHARVLGISASRNKFVGILFFHAIRGLVRNSSGNGSTFHDGDGIAMFDSRRIRVLDSTFKNNDHGILSGGSTNSLIKGNVIARGGDVALLMEGGEGFRVTRNRVIRNGGGILLGPGSENVIIRNRVRGHGDGIRIEKGRGNLVAHNVVIGARNGIRLGIRHPFLGGAHNVVRRNLVRDSRADGLLVNKKDHHSLLKRNVARGAGDDGLDVKNPTTKLTGNRALRNDDLGIEAVRGVIDGGGNIARHNGDPRQCTNIACS
jgi:parallel beta-helix repeat protein